MPQLSTLYSIKQVIDEANNTVQLWVSKYAISDAPISYPLSIAVGDQLSIVQLKKINNTIASAKGIIEEYIEKYDTINDQVEEIQFLINASTHFYILCKNLLNLFVKMLIKEDGLIVESQPFEIKDTLSLAIAELVQGIMGKFQKHLALASPEAFTPIEKFLKLIKLRDCQKTTLEENLRPVHSQLQESIEIAKTLPLISPLKQISIAKVTPSIKREKTDGLKKIVAYVKTQISTITPTMPPSSNVLFLLKQLNFMLPNLELLIKEIDQNFDKIFSGKVIHYITQKENIKKMGDLVLNIVTPFKGWDEKQFQFLDEMLTKSDCEFTYMLIEILKFVKGMIEEDNNPFTYLLETLVNSIAGETVTLLVIKKFLPDEIKPFVNTKTIHTIGNLVSLIINDADNLQILIDFLDEKIKCSPFMQKQQALCLEFSKELAFLRNKEADMPENDDINYLLYQVKCLCSYIQLEEKVICLKNSHTHPFSSEILPIIEDTQKQRKKLNEAIVKQQSVIVRKFNTSIDNNISLEEKINAIEVALREQQLYREKLDAACIELEKIKADYRQPDSLKEIDSTSCWVSEEAIAKYKQKSIFLEKYRTQLLSEKELLGNVEDLEITEGKIKKISKEVEDKSIVLKKQLKEYQAIEVVIKYLGSNKINIVNLQAKNMEFLHRIQQDINKNREKIFQNELFLRSNFVSLQAQIESSKQRSGWSIFSGNQYKKKSDKENDIHNESNRLTGENFELMNQNAILEKELKKIEQENFKLIIDENRLSSEIDQYEKEKNNLESEIQDTKGMVASLRKNLLKLNAIKNITMITQYFSRTQNILLGYGLIIGDVMRLLLSEREDLNSTIKQVIENLGKSNQLMAQIEPLGENGQNEIKDILITLKEDTAFCDFIQKKLKIIDEKIHSQKISIDQQNRALVCELSLFAKKVITQINADMKSIDKLLEHCNSTINSMILPSRSHLFFPGRSQPSLSLERLNDLSFTFDNIQNKIELLQNHIQSIKNNAQNEYDDLKFLTDPLDQSLNKLHQKEESLKKLTENQRLKKAHYFYSHEKASKSLRNEVKSGYFHQLSTYYEASYKSMNFFSRFAFSKHLAEKKRYVSSLEKAIHEYADHSLLEDDFQNFINIGLNQVTNGFFTRHFSTNRQLQKILLSMRGEYQKTNMYIKKIAM